MKFSFMNRNLDDVSYVFHIHIPIEQPIEVHQTYFVALALIEPVSAMYPVLYQKQLLTKLLSIDPYMPTSFPCFIFIKAR